MAINQIETGYKPEFGLGAMWAGENAANAEMANQLDFIKQFLANQREQQIQPLDVRVKDMEASRADVAKSPEMLDAYRRGYLGQADTQEAAGTKAKALLPFAIASERAKAEREGAEHGLFGNMYKGVAKQYDQSIPDNERIAAGQNAYALADTMSRVDPKTMAQERMLNGKLLSAEELMQLRLAQAAKLAEDKANAPPKPLTMSQMEALYRDRLAKDPNDAEAKQFLAEYERFKQTTQPGMGNVTIDPVTKKLTTIGGNLGSGPATQKPDPLGIR